MQVIFQEEFIKSKCKSEPGRILLLSPSCHPGWDCGEWNVQPQGPEFLPTCSATSFPPQASAHSVLLGLGRFLQ